MHCQKSSNSSEMSCLFTRLQEKSKKISGFNFYYLENYIKVAPGY